MKIQSKKVVSAPWFNAIWRLARKVRNGKSGNSWHKERPVGEAGCLAEHLERRTLLSALSFTTIQSPTTGAAPWSVAVADVNGDGILDLVACNEGSNTVSVLLGNANGTFAAPQSFAAGNNPFSVTVADLNGDTKPDLIVGDLGGVSILWGNGNGTFQAPQSTVTGNGPASVAVDSYNGNYDVIVTNDLSNDVSVLRYEGQNAFAAPVTYATGSNPDSVAVADLNGDGIPDLIITNDADGTVSVLLGNSNGTFQPQQTYATGREPHSVAVADLTSDNKPDLVVTNYLDNTVSILLGNGNGTFQPQQTFAAGSGPWGIAVADVNGDGNADLIVSNSGDDTVGVLLGNGDASFAPQQTFATGADPHAVAVSSDELLVANSGGNSVSVLMGHDNQVSLIEPTFSRIHAPSSAVAGAPVKTDLSISLTNHGASTRGQFNVSIYADTGQQLDGSQVLLASVVRKNLALKAGRSTIVSIGLTSFPSTLPAGKYYLLAEVTDPTDLTNVVASSQTVQIAAPFVQLQVTVSAVKPDEWNPDKTAGLSVTVANTGNIDAVGPLEITVNPSADGHTPLSNLALATLSRKVKKIRTGKNATFQLRLKAPASLLAGKYFPFASVSLAGVIATGVNPNQFTII